VGSVTGVPEEEQLGFGWLAQVIPMIASGGGRVEAGHRDSHDADVEYRNPRRQRAPRWFKGAGRAACATTKVASSNG